MAFHLCGRPPRLITPAYHEEDITHILIGGHLRVLLKVVKVTENKERLRDFLEL